MQFFSWFLMSPPYTAQGWGSRWAADSSMAASRAPARMVFRWNKGKSQQPQHLGQKDAAGESFQEQPENALGAGALLSVCLDWLQPSHFHTTYSLLESFLNLFKLIGHCPSSSILYIPREALSSLSLPKKMSCPTLCSLFFCIIVYFISFCCVLFLKLLTYNLSSHYIIYFSVQEDRKSLFLLCYLEL